MAKNILIVDDSVSMRGMVRSALTAGSFNVIEAANGGDALATLDRHGVDLIITDVNMPGMDGISLVKHIRQRAGNKFTPVLILTTESGAEMKQAGRAAGATGWIVKPFSPQQLVQLVAKVLPPEAGQGGKDRSDNA
jgi:two-component system chemotaxis response regulator CheY